MQNVRDSSNNPGITPYLLNYYILQRVLSSSSDIINTLLSVCNCLSFIFVLDSQFLLMGIFDLVLATYLDIFMCFTGPPLLVCVYLAFIF